MQNNRNGQHTLVGVEDGWEVLDVAQAVATQRQAGAGEAQPIVLSSTAHTVSLNQICVQMEQMIGLRRIGSKGEGRQGFEQLHVPGSMQGDSTIQTWQDRTRTHHDVEGTLLVEGRAGVAVGHNDLHGARTVDDGPHAPLVLIPVSQPRVSTRD